MEWEALEAACRNCTGCPLAARRQSVVFGDGCQDAKIMLVGEGPGAQEDIQGLPFVGPAGQLLDQMLSIIDLDRKKNCYIANIVKCRPPGNRDPEPREQDACIGYLENQIALVQPKILVCLGRIAAQRLIEPGFRITSGHGNWVQRNGIWMTAIYHPSALLRAPEKRPETFEDLLSIREKYQELGIEI